MITRRLVGVIGVACAGAVSVGLAVPVHAATLNVSDVDCQTGTLTGTPITGAPGDELNFTVAGEGCNIAYVNTNLVSSSSGISTTLVGGAVVDITQVQSPFSAWEVRETGQGQADFQTFVVTLANNPGTFRIFLQSQQTTRSTTWDVTIVPNSVASTPSSLPSAVIQQFGMPATATCDEAQPEGLNLSGVPSVGWGVSWAQWMNGGTGGAVCTRTLNYSTAQSKWVVN